MDLQPAEGLVGVLVALIVGLAAGAAIGWQLRRQRERTKRQAREAWESEMARAAGCARDRAFQEREEVQTRLQRLTDEHQRCETKIDGLAKKLRTSNATVEELKGKLANTNGSTVSKDERIHALHSRIGELEASIEERDERDGTPDWLLAEPGGATDKLTAIKGLGPVLERRLNALGIYRYNQLARMTPANARWIAMRLQVVPGRILRDRWAEQARDLSGAPKPN